MEDYTANMLFFLQEGKVDILFPILPAKYR